jgi:pimeloyl-ACP methyl ester carboxylesterase
VRHVFPGVQLQFEQRRGAALGKEWFIGGNLRTPSVQNSSKLALPLHAVVGEARHELVATTMLAALLVVGSLTLHPCAGASGYYCGAIARPLDPAGIVPGTISIGFTWLPHANASAPASGTIVAAEGGPGYPSGGSRDGYRALFAPLLDTRDLLLMDDRGTGRSGAIDCKPLQRAKMMTLGNVTACGTQLGNTSDLYGTDLAADDLNAIEDALGVKTADMYGDSYGTFFVQVFSARHPDRVASVTLDGAYPAIGSDPWYVSTGPTIQRAYTLVCSRGTCPLHGSPTKRIDKLLIALRKPHAPVTPTQLAFVMDTAGLDTLNYRDLDAAVRAYNGNHDAVPLLRLVRETENYEEQPAGGVHDMSQGLFVAASCSDNPQAYDMTLAPPQRQLAWQSALAQERQTAPALYAPFSLDEFLDIPLDFSYVPLCQTWPVASAAHPAGHPVPSGARMPDVPALVLTGDLDTITTPAEGDQAAALFRNARRVIVENTGHVTAIGDPYDCASAIVRNFVARRPIDTACTRVVPAVRLVPDFPRTVAEMDRPSPGNAKRWNDIDLRKAGAAVAAASDALARVETLSSTSGAGLRGGTFTSATTKNGYTRITLHGVKWVTDLAVNGTVTYDTKGNASASLQFPAAAIHATWRGMAGFTYANITGSVGGRQIEAKMLVP